jgi:hypothetical protein
VDVEQLSICDEMFDRGKEQIENEKIAGNISRDW